MNEMAKRINKFWESTTPQNAHLGLTEKEASSRYKRAREAVGEVFPVKNKTVIDFGCGGGYIGKYVLDHGAKKYVAYDVAARSIRRARQNTAGYEDKTTFIQLSDHRWDFAAHEPDMIVALAVMIHFPSVQYMDNFLASCERSGAKYLVLEIRNNGRGTVMQKEPYSAGCFYASPKTCLTLETTPERVAAKLPNYELVGKTDPEKAPTNCQVLWFLKQDLTQDPMQRKGIVFTEKQKKKIKEITEGKERK